MTKDLCISYINDEQVEIKSKNEYNNFAFQFDHIFGMLSTQKEIYDYSAKELVESVLDGYNGTIFAYGQTASGKTYTMQGLLDNPEKEGIIPRMIRHVFHNIWLSNGDIEYTVKVSMVEIYMEKIRDLINLTKTNLAIRETKDKEIYIDDLSEHYVSTEDDILEMIRIGSENRTTSATSMNDASSRSHSIVIITLHQKNTKTLEAKTGKWYLVDLAGSEKISKTGSSGMTLEEAKIINKSLSTLGMVINALTDGKSSHIPYRESKWTRVLTESLGGNAKTCLIITCSPSEFNENETWSTLRFGTRAKKIKNKPIINKEVTIPEWKIKIEKLEKMIVLFNNRVAQWEEYISSNNWPVPSSDNINGVTENATNNPSNDYINSHNLISNELDDKIGEIETKYSKAWNQMSKWQGEQSSTMEKLEEANIKIADWQAIIEQKEKLEEEFENKEKQYKETINKLSYSLENFQSNNALKKNLKIIDKRTLEEFLNQMKSFIQGAKSGNKGDKALHAKIMESISWIINNNTNKGNLTKEDVEKWSTRLKCETTNKIQFLGGSVLDYKDMSDNLVLNNITNDTVLKTIKDKNDQITRLEWDVKEYKDKIKIFENELTPEEKNWSKKIYTWEKNWEQVNNMYHQVITQKSVLKIENQIYEKKLKKRNEKICMLVKENYGLLEQLKMRDDKWDYYQKSKTTAIPQVVMVWRGAGRTSSSNESNNTTNKIL